MQGYPDVFTLDPYDLALVKLILGRRKDLELVRSMLGLGILQLAPLRERYQKAPLGKHQATTAGRNLRKILDEID